MRLISWYPLYLWIPPFLWAPLFSQWFLPFWLPQRGLWNDRAGLELPEKFPNYSQYLRLMRVCCCFSESLPQFRQTYHRKLGNWWFEALWFWWRSYPDGMLFSRACRSQPHNYPLPISWEPWRDRPPLCCYNLVTIFEKLSRIPFGVRLRYS